MFPIIFEKKKFPAIFTFFKYFKIYFNLVKENNFCFNNKNIFHINLTTFYFPGEIWSASRAKDNLIVKLLKQCTFVSLLRDTNYTISFQCYLYFSDINCFTIRFFSGEVIFFSLYKKN